MVALRHYSNTPVSPRTLSLRDGSEHARPQPDFMLSSSFSAAQKSSNIIDLLHAANFFMHEDPFETSPPAIVVFRYVLC